MPTVRSQTERWTARPLVLQPPRTEERLRKNPLGIYVNGLSWSRELEATDCRRKREHTFPKILFLLMCPGWLPAPGAARHAEISLDEPVLVAEPLPEPPKPIEVVEVPKPLPLPEQLKALPTKADGEGADPQREVRLPTEARIAPTREGYVNAIQVWPYADGALYQVYTSPGRVTVIALQQGEELVTVSAGDTVRWIVGDTASGGGATLRVNILVKPTRIGLKTNLVVTTNRRTYLLELSSTPQAWMASVSWDYPRDLVPRCAGEQARRPGARR